MALKTYGRSDSMNDILYELNAPICHEDDIDVYSPETSLYLRWEALCERKQELEDKSSAYDSYDASAIWTESDLRYVLPEHFCSMRNVMQAIDIAEWDLRTKYGIEVLHILEAHKYTKPIRSELLAV